MAYTVTSLIQMNARPVRAFKLVTATSCSHKQPITTTNGTTTVTINCVRSNLYQFWWFLHI